MLQYWLWTLVPATHSTQCMPLSLLHFPADVPVTCLPLAFIVFEVGATAATLSLDVTASSPSDLKFCLVQGLQGSKERGASVSWVQDEVSRGWVRRCFLSRVTRDQCE